MAEHDNVAGNILVPLYLKRGLLPLYPYLLTHILIISFTISETPTDKKRLGIILKGQDNYLLQSTEKRYKLYLRALQKYITGEATTLANNASSKDKEKYTLRES